MAWRAIVRRELGRTRANSRESAWTPPAFTNSSQTFFSRELCKRSVNSPEFARIRTEFAVNWQTVRQNNVIVSGYFKIFATNDSSPQTIVQSKSLPRTVFWVNGCSPTGEYVRGGLSPLDSWRTRSRRTIVQFHQCSRRTLFAAGGQNFATGGYCSRRTSANNVRCHQYPPAANSCPNLINNT